MKSTTNSGRKSCLRAGMMGCEPDDEDQISLLLELLGWRVDLQPVPPGGGATPPDVLFVGSGALENETAVSIIKNSHATEMVVVFRGAKPMLDVQIFPFERTAYIVSPLDIVALERLIETFS